MNRWRDSSTVQITLRLDRLDSEQVIDTTAAILADEGSLQPYPSLSITAHQNKKPRNRFEIARAAHTPTFPVQLSSIWINPFIPFANLNSFMFSGWFERVDNAVLIAEVTT